MIAGLLGERSKAILSKPIGIVMTGLLAAAALGQTTTVLTGGAAYGDWRSDAPGVRRKITPADLPPTYSGASSRLRACAVAL